MPSPTEEMPQEIFLDTNLNPQRFFLFITTTPPTVSIHSLPASQKKKNENIAEGWARYFEKLGSEIIPEKDSLPPTWEYYNLSPHHQISHLRALQFLQKGLLLTQSPWFSR